MSILNLARWGLAVRGCAGQRECGNGKAVKVVMGMSGHGSMRYGSSSCGRRSKGGDKW